MKPIFRLPKLIPSAVLLCSLLIGTQATCWSANRSLLKAFLKESEEGIQLMQCDQSRIILGYNQKSDTTKNTSHSFYLAVFPSGSNTPRVTDYTFEISNPDGTIREIHSTDSDAPPVTTPEITSCVNLTIFGFVRDYRIARCSINLPSRLSLPGNKTLTGRITYMRIEIQNQSSGDIILSEPSKKKIGLENVLSNIVFNYEYAGELRGKPILPSGRDSSNYPGLPAPNFYQPGQNWMKLSVTKPGIYKVTFTDLLKNGVSPSVIEPRTFRIFSEGKEIPITILGPRQDHFVPENAVVFYGEPISNIYTETGIYWLTWGGETGLQIPLVQQPELSLSTGVECYWETVHLQEKHEYETSVNPPQPSHWFWKTIYAGESSVHTVSISNLVVTPTDSTKIKYPKPDIANEHSLQITFNGETIHADKWENKNLLDVLTSLPLQRMKEGGNQLQLNFTASVAPDTETTISHSENFGKVRIGLYGKGDISGGHHIQVTVNGSTIGNAKWTGTTYYELSTTIPAQLLKEGNNQIGVTLVANTTGNDEIYLDFVELSYPRQIRIGKGTEEISFKRLLSGTTVQRIYISSAGKPLHEPVILSLDSAMNLTRRIPVLDETRKQFYFDLSTTDRYYITDLASIESPPIQKEEILNNLRSRDNQADVIYITHPDFLPAVNKLSEYRKKQGFSTRIVNIYDIYDQFSDGVFDPRAIQKFLQYSFYFWKSPSPNYVVFVGDANWDYMDFQETGTKVFIPSYRSPDQEILNDDIGSIEDFYVQLCPQNSYPDMVLGRISVETLKDAQAVVEKTITQETGSELGTWRTTSIIAADDGFENDAQEAINDYLPLWMTPDVLHLQDYGYMDHQKFPKASRRKQSPDATTALLEKMNHSSPFMLYVGHGGGGVWSHTRLFVAGSGVRTSDTFRLHNTNRNLFIYTMSCLNGYFDYPNPPWQSISAEMMIQYPDRGAIAMMVPTGKGGTGQHLQLGKGLAQAFFKNQVRSIGDAIYQAKLLYLFTTSDFGISQMYLILGDPLAQNAIPQKSITLDLFPKSIQPSKENHVRISGIMDSELKDGFVTLGVYSEETPKPLVEKSKIPFKGGKFETDLSLPSSDKKLTLRAYAWNEKSRVDAAGAMVIPIQESNVQFAFVSQTTNSKANFLQLKNLLPEPIQSYTIKVILKNVGRTQSSFTQKVQKSLDGQQENSFPIPSTVPPGVYDADIQFNGQISSDRAGLISCETTFSFVVKENQSLPMFSDKKVRPLGIAESEISIEPKEITAGDKVIVKIPLHNYGNATIENIPYECKINGVSLNTTMWIPFITPFGTHILQIPWTVPPTYLSPTQKEKRAEFQMKIDTRLQIARTFLVRQLPVLVITHKDIKITPVKPSEGETIFFDITVQNQGQLPAQGITVSGYNGDPEKGGQEITNMASVPTQSIRLLNPGESKTLRLRWDPPLNSTGYHLIYLIVDKQKQIREADRSNQLAVIPLRIYKNADLAVSPADITWYPQQPYAGETIRVSAVIHNIGETDALTAYPWGENQSHAFDVKFHYRKSNGVESSFGTLYIPILQAGRSTTVQMQAVAPTDMRSMIVKVDAENEVLEIEEYANNIAEKPIFVKHH